MNTTQSMILVVEDNPDNSTQLVSAINGLSTNGVDFQELFLQILPKNKQLTQDSQIPDEENFRQFLMLDNLDQVSLCFVDSELGRFRQNDDLPILNKDLISRVCGDLGIPVCVYSDAADEDDLERLSNWTHRYVVIDRNLSFDALAQLGVNISEGFEQIRNGLREDSAVEKDTLSQLGKILNMPEDAYSHLGLYSIGQVSALPIKLQKAGLTPDVLSRAKSVSMGYWLYNSVLRYPGILLNTAALGSYLDIDPDYLDESTEIKGAFDKALYKGPFYEVEPHWWKCEIDSLLVECPNETAREYLDNLGTIDIDKLPQAMCTESGEPDGVGYYCIAKKQPVCEVHSAGGHSWLPGGAVLSRISQSIWDGLSPFYAL